MKQLNWYEYSIVEKEIFGNSLAKSAGIKDNIAAILMAVSLVLGGMSVSEAAEKANVNPQTVEKAVNNPKIVNMAKEEKLTDVEDVIARTLYAEAEGESYEGKKAVASVIWNRAKSNIGNIVSVIKKPKQFSCWNSGTPKTGKGQAWKDCVSIAKEMSSGSFTPTTNANHYYNPSLCNPSWAKGKKGTDIGHHRFLKL